MEPIDTQQITLRALEPSDLDLVFRWENDPSVWPLGNTIAPLSRFQLDEYIRAYSADIFRDRQLRLMIVDATSGTSVGTIDLYDFEPQHGRAAVGIFIDPAHRRRGFASAAIDAIKRLCRDRLGFVSLWCTIAVTNVPSLQLFESRGFEVSGTLRSWIRRGDNFIDAFILQNLDL